MIKTWLDGSEQRSAVGRIDDHISSNAGRKGASRHRSARARKSNGAFRAHHSAEPLTRWSAAMSICCKVAIGKALIEVARQTRAFPHGRLINLFHLIHVNTRARQRGYEIFIDDGDSHAA